MHHLKEVTAPSEKQWQPLAVKQMQGSGVGFGSSQQRFFQPPFYKKADLKGGKTDVPMNQLLNQNEEQQIRHAVI